MKYITIFSIGTLCLSACLVANGQEGERKPGADRVGEFLKRADSNADGKISKEEMTAFSKRDIDERFTKMDANGDGFIDQTEVASIGERMRDGMRNRGEGGRPGAPSGEGGFRRPPGESPPPEGKPRPEGDRPGPRPEGDRPGPRPEGGRPAGGPPAGGPGGGMMLDEMFGRMDKNSDGSIDKEEYAEFSKKESEQRFTRIDENTDGKVSKDEMKAGFEKLRGMMRGPGGPGGPGGPPGEGGFRRPGGPEGGQGGFRRPPTEGGSGRPRPEAEGDAPKKKDAA